MADHRPPGRPRSGRDRRSAVVALLGAIALLAAAVPTVASATPSSDGRRVVVTFAPGSSARDRGAALSAADLGRPTSTHALTAPNTPSAPFTVVEATADQRARLAADPAVVSVEPDVPTRATGVTPVDPAWPAQEGLREVGADDAWERTTGDDDVVIAVVDTGVDIDNADLAGKLTAGYDLVNDDADADDDNGHGTAVATIAAARTSNTVGIAGACWRCRIMPLKALDGDGAGFLSDAARAVVWAVERDADIINLSLGAPSDLEAMRSALDAADRAGVVVVASAGNADSTDETYPAADPRAISTAALDGDARASYSNHGDSIDVAAPGCNPAVDPDDDVIGFCGTSSAAPVVSGVAGLALSTRADATDDDVREAILLTAEPVGPGLGAGRIDADAAVAAVATGPTDDGPALADPPPGPDDDPAAGAPPEPGGPGEPGDPQGPEPSEDPEPPRDAVPRFGDTEGTFHADAIRRIAEEGITGGCDAGRFCPARRVTRGQMATFLDRALDLPSGGAAFADVPRDHPHAEGIRAVVAAGIADGCAVDRFCPGAGLTRAQMASLLARALDLAPAPEAFDDVTRDDVHAGAIGAVADDGITRGCAAERFCPGAAVTRGQMATFLVRSFDL